MEGRREIRKRHFYIERENDRRLGLDVVTAVMKNKNFCSPRE